MNTFLIISCCVLLILFVVLSIILLKKIQISGKTAEIAAKTADNAITKDELSLLAGQLSTNFAQQLGLMSQNISSQTTAAQQQMEAVRTAVSVELQQIRRENAENLAEIRQTVDEKLQTTLEKRLGESFNQVGARLEQVHQGLGEMQTLAGNVGDLQKLLRNVKIRGTWGEVQLGSILAQMLAPNQFAANVRPNPNSTATVEYAVKIPDTAGDFIWLPIDAKCPLEDYQRLTAAEENNDANEIAKSLTALCARIKAEARSVSEKYICQPYTTDFAILFLPLEGLFAEVLQQQALCESLQKDYKVLVAGPTTLSAVLNILQLGYQSIAIQARANEVWNLLGQVKTEFAQFGNALEKSRKKIQEAGNSLEVVGRRTRVMERKLKDLANDGLENEADISTPEEEK